MICDTKRYKNLRSCPPALSVVGNPREVKIVLIGQLGRSWRWIMRKDSYGDFKICTGTEAYCNSHIGYPKDDIEWVADEGSWDKVFEMINSGVYVIESIKYR